MLLKQNLKKPLAILLLAAGLFSFKIIQPNTAINESFVEEKFEDQVDSTKEIKNGLKSEIGYNDEIVFIRVEHPATFPGGLEGWKTFLETNLKYPEKAQRHGTQGIVKVQLLVDKNGNVKEIKALNDPGDGLGKEAERVLKKSPNWIPATQNGIKVNYRFAQTITFQLQ